MLLLVPLADVLAARAVLVFVGRDSELVPQEAAALQPDQGRGRGVTPLRNEDDEGERLSGAVQELLRTHTHTHTHVLLMLLSEETNSSYTHRWTMESTNQGDGQLVGSS